MYKLQILDILDVLIRKVQVDQLVESDMHDLGDDFRWRIHKPDSKVFDAGISNVRDVLLFKNI
jgi:hypothetical protein